MSDTDRSRLVEHLKSEWLGPAFGENEILHRSPVYAYLVGTLFPIEKGIAQIAPTVSDPVEDPEDEAAYSSQEGHDEDEDDDEDPGQAEDDADEDIGLNLTGAFGWAPQSLGLSFIHDATRILVSVRAGSYSSLDAMPASAAGADAVAQTSERPEIWQRQQLSELDIEIPTSAAGSQLIFNGRASLSWRNRFVRDRVLTTIAVSNSKPCAVGMAKADPSICLFQVSFSCSVSDGQIYPYPVGQAVNPSDDDLELELRYRNRSTFAIGHGTSASWNESLITRVVSTESLPTELVPSVRARKSTSPHLELRILADDSLPLDELVDGLLSFVSDYGNWVTSQEDEATSAPPRLRNTATELTSKQRGTVNRMAQGVRLLAQDGSTLTAFRLANEAMRTQMLQQQLARAYPGEIDVPLTVLDDVAREPRWHPFQLGFILCALTSTIDEEHEDRSVVDLIWFPTGGGKTEAYLGLAAIEMIRRRLDRGIHGGGTAVVTRYTMRLLTAQQFQRAATLICSLELIRRSDARLQGTAPFTIGLWVGNTTTPGSYKDAEADFKRVLRDLNPENRFQLRQCSWCGTSILPARQTPDLTQYGIRATSRSFNFYCPHPECPFHDNLPLQVVDEGIFEAPPTMLVATVDKFARLAWIEKGASLFGLGGVTFDPPSLVIQDELHLITGPLGTVVGIYEAAFRSLMNWSGTPPKVVASTATIRAASEQVRELMASKVSIFPPSGLSIDDNFFSEPDPDTPGRLYLGIMPQAHTPSWALGQIATELLQSPIALDFSDASKDAYWTLVMYHNSLRELGRTMTILRDDVRSGLDRKRLITDGAVREMARDGVEELNGNVSAEDLLRLLDQLAIGPDSKQGTAIDALATTNILSVGIDISRLGLMLVNGHPKSTSEYIQATSRVGRGSTPGLVITMFRSGKPRDRSVFESFKSFHSSYYRHVEPASVTPWSVQARRRAIRSAFVILMRHAGGLSANGDAARFDSESAVVRKATTLLKLHIESSDPREAQAAVQEITLAIADWTRRAGAVAENGDGLKFTSREPGTRLLKQFTDEGQGWPTMNSMRSVDKVVRIRVDGERR